MTDPDIVTRLRIPWGAMTEMGNSERAEAADEIERLRKERDEARREVCGFHHLTGFLAGDYANSRGWYCFPDRNCKFEPSVYDFKLLLEGQDKIFLERIDRITADRDKAIAERDEARRRVCENAIQHGRVYRRVGRDTVRCETPQQVAEVMGWDCYKENKENTND